ncbi:MAG: hypothetical protein K1X89_08290 [Myxococcaceae bacterium]|nr:hypothetical protein [Myxococcaceae bacterium]
MKRRWPLVVLGVVAIAVAVLLVATAPRLDEPAEHLLREVTALTSKEYPRPSHVDAPLPGSFGERAAAPLTALSKVTPLMGAVDKEPVRCVDQAAKGQVFWPACQTLLDAARDGARGVLEATRAERGGVPITLSAITSLTQPTQASELYVASTTAVLEISRLQREGHLEEALSWCLDAYALARDSSFGSGLLGHMLCVANTTRLLKVCPAVLQALSPPARADALARIDRIYAGVPPLADTLLMEENAMGLVSHAQLLSDEQRGRLPLVAQNAIRTFAPAGRLGYWFASLTSSEARELLRGWGPMQRYFHEAQEATRLPPAERESRIVRAREELERDLGSPSLLAPDLLKFTQRADRIGASQELLHEAVRLMDAPGDGWGAVSKDTFTLNKAADGSATLTLAAPAGELSIELRPR